MLCDRCHKRQAVIYIKTIINGHIQMMGLCEACGAQLSGEYAEDDAVYGVFGNTKNETARCTACGTLLSDIVKSGYFGCENCYRQFKETVKPVIRRMHGVDFHKGKLPASAGEELKLVFLRRKIIEERERSYVTGDSARAAELGLRLKELEEEMTKRGINYGR